MKKLVTIVSAVMMLLMLAACAPTLMSPDAEQQAAIDKANIAYGIIESYVSQHSSDYVKSNGDIDFTVDEDIEEPTFTIPAVGSEGAPGYVAAKNYTDLTIKKGSAYTMTTTGTDTETTVIVFDVELSWTQKDKVGDEMKDVVYSVSVSYESTTSEVVSGENEGDTTYKLGPFYIDGVAYEPTYAPFFG